MGSLYVSEFSWFYSVIIDSEIVILDNILRLFDLISCNSRRKRISLVQHTYQLQGDIGPLVG